MTFDGKAFGAEIVAAVKSFLDRELTPIVRRLDDIERRLSELPTPRDGKDADLADVRRMIDDSVEAVTKMVDAISVEPQMSEVTVMVRNAVADAVAAIPAPRDGKSVSIDDVEPIIVSEIQKRIDAIPRAKDGVDGSDGAGLADAFIDRDGELIVTMSNGTAKKLGPVVGKDGEPGKDGRDGFNLEEFDATLMEDGRTVLLSFDRKDFSYKVELGFPVMLYRGVFKEGEYEKGDTVTWGGSLWHCDVEKTTEKPGDTSSDWTLCAKRGRDGRDGTAKELKPTEPVRVGIPAGAR